MVNKSSDSFGSFRGNSSKKAESYKELETLHDVALKSKMTGLLSSTESEIAHANSEAVVAIIDNLRGQIGFDQIQDPHDRDRIDGIITGLGLDAQKWLNGENIENNDTIHHFFDYVSKQGFRLKRVDVSEERIYDFGISGIKKGIHIKLYAPSGKLKEHFVFDLKDTEKAEKKYLEIRTKLDKWDKIG